MPSTPIVFRAALPLLLLFTLLFYANFVSRVILGPFLPDIEAEFAVTHAQAGGLFFFVALGMSISMVLSGAVAKLLNHRGTILLSTFAVGGCMVAVSQMPTFAMLRATLFCMGMAGGLYFPSSISCITSLIEQRHWGKGLAVHELAPNLAFISVPLTGVLLQGVVPWRMVFMGFGILGIGVGILFLLKGRGGDFPGEAPNPRTIFSEILVRPAFWALAFTFALAIAASFGPYSMLALFLTDEIGMDLERAQGLLSASRIAGPFMALGTGFIVDRIGANRTAMLSLGATGLMTALLGLTEGMALDAAVILQPTLAVCFFPAGLTAVSEFFETRVRNLAVALIVPIAILLGSGLTPTFLGWFGDRAMFAQGFLGLGVLIILGVPVQKFLGRPAHQG